MILRRNSNLEARMDRMEQSMGALLMELKGARSNFLIAVNQIGKLKEYVDSHVHTMTDDNGQGSSRPQSDVINILHEMMQVLEQEANTMRVDQNGMRTATSDLSQRMTELENGVRRLCARMGAAVEIPAVLGFKKND